MSDDTKSEMRYWSKVAKRNNLAYAGSLDKGVNYIEKIEKELSELKANSIPVIKLEDLIEKYTNKSGTMKVNTYPLFVLNLKRLIKEVKDE